MSVRGGEKKKRTRRRWIAACVNCSSSRNFNLLDTWFGRPTSDSKVNRYNIYPVNGRYIYMYFTKIDLKSLDILTICLSRRGGRVPLSGRFSTFAQRLLSHPGKPLIAGANKCPHEKVQLQASVVGVRILTYVETIPALITGLKTRGDGIFLLPIRQQKLR